MQRYFYHLRTSSSYLQDHEGSTHPDPGTALREARDCIIEIMKSQLDQGYIDLEQSLEIVSETGDVLAHIPFSTAIRWRK